MILKTGLCSISISITLIFHTVATVHVKCSFDLEREITQLSSAVTHSENYSSRAEQRLWYPWGIYLTILPRSELMSKSMPCPGLLGTSCGTYYAAQPNVNYRCTRELSLPWLLTREIYTIIIVLQEGMTNSCDNLSISQPQCNVVKSLDLSLRMKVSSFEHYEYRSNLKEKRFASHLNVRIIKYSIVAFFFFI